MSYNSGNLANIACGSGQRHLTFLRCAANVVTASEAREPNAYRDCSNRLLESRPSRYTPLPNFLSYHLDQAIHVRYQAPILKPTHLVPPQLKPDRVSYREAIGVRH